MRLPTYPIVTIDPHFSIWSRQDKLTDGDTYLWCGIKKRIEGKLTVDGETFRFLGKGKEKEKALEQVDNKITPYISSYIFENEKVRLTFSTWSPFILDDFHLLSTPCAYLDTAVKTMVIAYTGEYLVHIGTTFIGRDGIAGGSASCRSSHIDVYRETGIRIVPVKSPSGYSYASRTAA